MACAERRGGTGGWGQRCGGGQGAEGRGVGRGQRAGGWEGGRGQGGGKGAKGRGRGEGGRREGMEKWGRAGERREQRRPRQGGEGNGERTGQGCDEESKNWRGKDERVGEEGVSAAPTTVPCSPCPPPPPPPASPVRASAAPPAAAADTPASAAAARVVAAALCVAVASAPARLWAACRPRLAGHLPAAQPPFARRFTRRSWLAPACNLSPRCLSPRCLSAVPVGRCKTGPLRGSQAVLTRSALVGSRW
ncbi:unnamed protein product [Closterium sp. NIES-54]